MMKMLLFCALLCLSHVSGCALPQAPPPNPVPYTGNYRTRDIELLWMAQKGEKGVTVEGVASNLFTFQVEDLELDALLLDPEGKELGKRIQFIPGTIFPNESSPFTMTIPFSSGGNPAHMKMTLSYRIRDTRIANFYQYFTFEADIVPKMNPRNGVPASSLQERH